MLFNGLVVVFHLMVSLVLPKPYMQKSCKVSHAHTHDIQFTLSLSLSLSGEMRQNSWQQKYLGKMRLGETR